MLYLKLHYSWLRKHRLLRLTCPLGLLPTAVYFGSLLVSACPLRNNIRYSTISPFLLLITLCIRYYFLKPDMIPFSFMYVFFLGWFCWCHVWRHKHLGFHFAVQLLSLTRTWDSSPAVTGSLGNGCKTLLRKHSHAWCRPSGHSSATIDHLGLFS